MFLKEKIHPSTFDHILEKISSADIPRSAWGAKEPNMNHLIPRKRPITQIIIATNNWDPNSAIRQESDPIKQQQKTFEKMKEVQSKFIAKGYGDLVCHAVILYSGTVAAARPVKFSTPQDTDAYKIFLLGNLEKKGPLNQPTDKQLKRAVGYVAELLISLKLPLSAVKFADEMGTRSNMLPEPLDRDNFRALLEKEYNLRKLLEEVFVG